MKRNQPALLLGALGILTSSLAFAQNFQTMPIQSGLTSDVIANGVGSATVSTTTDVDGVSYAFVSQDFQATATSPALTYGLPTNGIINSVVTSTPGLSYVMANYSSNNSLKLSNQNDTGTITFTTPKAAFKLYMLATTGSGSSTVTVVVNFTDNTSQTFTGVAVSDWYDNTGFAIQGFGRINRNTNALESGGGTNPRLYQSLLAIDPANQAKLIQSVTITKTSTAQGHANIFAFSADAYSTCAAPSLNAVGALTSNSAAVSWTPATGTTATNYEIYYSTTNTAPTSTTTPILTGLSGTSTTIPGLAANTNYYYWVRANCGGTPSQSTWSFSGTFKTACGAVTSMSENFDSYGTGNIVPDCWVRNYVNGTMSISSTTPASGTRNIYQTTSTTQTPSTVVLPEFSNVNAGTHWLKLKARVSAATGTLNVGYVTNPTDASTFVLLQALSISNTNYTSGNSEYTVILPSTVPATARLAVRNTADGKGYYWDDVVWEAVPSCFPPTAVSTSAVTTNSVTLSWTAPSSAPANGYEYYYSTTNTAPTATTTISGTSAAGTVSKVVSGLSSATNYFIWIRSSCSTTSNSTWSYVGTFTTACTSTSVPYTENFESVTTPALPNCTVAQNVGAGNTWATYSPGSNGFTTKVLSYLYSTSSAANTWFYTQGINLTAGTQYTISYKYGNNGGTTYVEKMKVAYGASADAAAMTNAIADHPNITNSTAAITETINFTPTTSGIYYFGFNCYSIADRNRLFLDDISIAQSSLSTSEVTAAKKDIKVYPNPFSDIINISEFKDIKTVKVTDVSGRTFKTIENPSKEINLSSLNAGLYLITMYFKDGSQHTVKTIKK